MEYYFYLYSGVIKKAKTEIASHAASKLGLNLEEIKFVHLSYKQEFTWDPKAKDWFRNAI